MGKASREEKDRSRARIVASAARLFRERGIEGASLNDVMKDAGLTHGGFYRHFATKDALLEAALEKAFEQIVAPLEANLAAAHPPGAVGRKFREFYLSGGHLENPGLGCPAAALASEVARTPESTKNRFAIGVRTMLSALARTKTGDKAARETAAAQELAMMVGALAIARASDPGTAELMISACRVERSRPWAPGDEAV